MSIQEALVFMTYNLRPVVSILGVKTLTEALNNAFSCIFYLWRLVDCVMGVTFARCVAHHDASSKHILIKYMFG